MFLSVSELTQLNVDLRKAIDKAQAAANSVLGKAEAARAEIKEKYSNSDWSELGRAHRQRAIQIETKQAMDVLRQELAGTKELLRDIQSKADQIKATEELYQPIKRLSWTTMLDPKLAERRSTFMRNLDGAGVAELETMLHVFKSTGDLAGLAALSAEINSRDDATLRKQIPNAHIVEGVHFGKEEDEAQLAVIFQSGRNAVQDAVEYEREVQATLNGRRVNGADKIRAGLRAKEGAA